MKAFKTKFAILILVVFSLALFSYSSKDELLMKKINKNPTPAEVRLKSFEKFLKMKEDSIFKDLEWKLVGPYWISGRVTDIAVSHKNHYKFYVAAASGGVWLTENNGQTFKPIFDNVAPMITIGDIAVSPKDDNVLWVGTGENNSSRSSYSGTGIYKTEDGGKTWKHMGLSETHHIGRIVIDPENPDIVYVAAIGHLYTRNPERGVYKTEDGGKTWKKVLFVDDNTGAIDIVMDPENSSILYAAMWERERRAWNFVESGDGSGIYKTEDGGRTWKKLKGGFPQGKYVGRIGLDICRANPNIIYAVLDNQEPQESKKKSKKKTGLTASDIKNMSKEEFLKLSDKELKEFARNYGLPKEYTADKLKKLVKEGKITPKMIAEYVIDEERALFETQIKGAQVWRSDDGGKTWKKMNKKRIGYLFHTYGYYFGQIRVNPKNCNQIYVLGVPLLKSNDGGKTFINIIAKDLHVDHHALWIDPENPMHLIDGNDGGVNISYDGGKNWDKIKTLPISQFYTINYDYRKPYRICGGLQDNGVVCGVNNFKYGDSHPWVTIIGGDGGYVWFDPENPDIVYTEYQFGYIFRINIKTKEMKKIRPYSKIGEEKLRFNWQTPFFISKYNNKILYLGANRVFKSYNGGDNWFPISGDLTTNPPQGDVPYGTITTISESPIKPGLLYVGTDDGLVWVTKNDGATWEKIVNGLPSGKWVSRIVASKYKLSRVYITLNGYRDDDFRTYIFVSENYGKEWKSIKSNLPDEPVNVLREDPFKENIIYTGTDRGVYVSLNRGKYWYSLLNNLPNAPVHDLRINPSTRELIIGTHGRSAFKLNVSLVEKVTPEILKKDFYVFKPDKKINFEFSHYTMGFSQKKDFIVNVYTPEIREVKVEIVCGKKKVFDKKFTVKGISGLKIKVKKYDEKLFSKKCVLKLSSKGKRYTFPVEFVKIMPEFIEPEGK